MITAGTVSFVGPNGAFIRVDGESAPLFAGSPCPWMTLQVGDRVRVRLTQGFRQRVIADVYLLSRTPAPNRREAPPSSVQRRLRQLNRAIELARREQRPETRGGCGP
jgi:hypothetical protein